MKLHDINKRSFYVYLYDVNRERKQDHAVAIYSIIEDGHEVWKVCDIQAAIKRKHSGLTDYRDWLSMDLITYLEKDSKYVAAIAFDDPNSNSTIRITNQNANDLKLYLAKYTPDYARNFIQDMGEKLHIRNINSINVAFGTSPDVIGIEKSNELKTKQHYFLWNFMKGNADPDEAPNV